MDEPDYVARSRAYQRAYYQAHRDAKIVYQRARWAANKDDINARRRASAPKNQRRNISTTDKREYNRRYHLEVQAEANLRERVHALQSVGRSATPACQACGETDVRVLAINHRNGDGGHERRAGRAGRWITSSVARGQRETSDLDVRCANCNIRFEYESERRRLPRDWPSVVAEEIATWQEPSTR